MSVNIRADRGEGKLKLFSDRRGVCALPPHPVQLGFLMVGHEASSFLKYGFAMYKTLCYAFGVKKSPSVRCDPEGLKKTIPLPYGVLSMGG